MSSGESGARRAVVIGVGNPYRSDDGVGNVVLDELRSSHSAEGRFEGFDGIEFVEESGEPVSLVQRWSGTSTAVLVDAVNSGREPGTIHRYEYAKGEWDISPETRPVSSHSLGIAEAVELGRVLDRLPERLVFLGVEVEDVSEGVGLSERVADAVAPAVRGIVEVLDCDVTKADR